jgi:hypothetical protein
MNIADIPRLAVTIVVGIGGNLTPTTANRPQSAGADDA